MGEDKRHSSILEFLVPIPSIPLGPTPPNKPSALFSVTQVGRGVRTTVRDEFSGPEFIATVGGTAGLDMPSTALP